jgi:hypothetical protein
MMLLLLAVYHYAKRTDNLHNTLLDSPLSGAAVSTTIPELLLLCLRKVKFTKYHMT